jgi:hypothetical protein
MPRRVGSDARAQLLVRALHLGMVAVDMLAGKPEQLFVVGSLEAVTTGTVDCSHHSSFRIRPTG